MNASGRTLTRLTVLGALSASGMTAALPVHADTSPEPSQKSAATELAALHEAPWDQRGDFILSPSALLRRFRSCLRMLRPRSPGQREVRAPVGSVRRGPTSTVTAVTLVTRSWPET